MNIIYAKPKLFFILIFSLLLADIQAQTVENIVAFADSQFRVSNYQSAIKEYQRAIFFNPKMSAQVYERLAECWFREKNYAKARQYYDLAFFALKNDSLRTEMIFRKTTCYINERDFLSAIGELSNLTDSISSNFEHRKNFYLGVCHYGLAQFDLAKNDFLQSLDSSQTNEKQQIAAIFDKRKNLYSPNPKTAFYLSLFLPGTGQFYAGDFKNGVNSMLLTTSLLVVGIRVAQIYSFWEAFLSVGGWFQRYYQGGYTNAEIIAEKRRSERRNQTFGRILTIIEKKHEKK